MKKLAGGLFSVLALSSVIAVNAVPTMAVASPDVSQVVFQQNEIKDQHVLLQRAEHGQSDLKFEKFHPKLELTNQKTKEKQNIKVYQTTQHLKTVKHSDGEVVETYSTTSIAPMSYTSNKMNSGDDSTMSVKATGTIYWSNVTEPTGVTYYSLDHVNGDWTIEDPSVSISDQWVRMGQAGDSYGYGGVDQYLDYYPTGLSFGDYYAPTSWYPVSSTGALAAAVGETLHCTLYGYNSSWNFTFTDNI